MNQTQLLNAVCERLETTTGNQYVIDYTPLHNISEQSREVYRSVSLGIMRKETATRGYEPVTFQEVIVSIFGLLPDSDETVADIQEELNNILDSFMSRRGPIVFELDNGFSATVKSGECRPVEDSGISNHALNGSPPVIVGSLSLVFLVC